jgi:hypothetical protein
MLTAQRAVAERNFTINIYFYFAFTIVRKQNYKTQTQFTYS